MSSNSTTGHQPRLTSDEAMLIWRARDRYRVQSFLSGLVLMFFLLEGLTFLLEGRWVMGLLMIGMQGGMLWGLLWLLRQGRKRIGTWWHGLGLVLLISLASSGCTDAVRAVAYLHGYKGDPYASPCTPASLQVGHCVTAKEGTK